MTQIFIDTNIFLRYLVDDRSLQHKESIALIEACESGKFRPYTSSVVISELIFVLTKLYKLPKKEVVGSIDKLLLIRNLTLIDKTNTPTALAFYRKFNVKFGDCLIASQIPSPAALITYDRDFSKFKLELFATPAEILSTLKSSN